LDANEYEGIDPEAYAQGWRRDLRDAIDEALAPHEVGYEAPIDIYVKKRRDNPVHDYRVVLRPGG
jgi:hypothetical protein